MENFIGHVSIQFFLFLSFVVLLPPVKPQDWWQWGDEKPGKMLQRTIIFKKRKWRKIECFESYRKLSAFEVQSFDCALCKTHQAESHYCNINILLKNLQVKMNGNTLETCFLFWPKALLWKRVWKPMCKPAFFVTFLVQPAVTPEKLQSCLGREFSVPVKHLALWNPECLLEALASTFTLG